MFSLNRPHELFEISSIQRTIVPYGELIRRTIPSYTCTWVTEVWHYCNVLCAELNVFYILKRHPRIYVITNKPLFLPSFSDFEFVNAQHQCRLVHELSSSLSQYRIRNTLWIYVKDLFDSNKERWLRFNPPFGASHLLGALNWMSNIHKK